ncbi:MutT-like protein [Cytospora mali]|uniref:MutT-like protein n=1 Tax=Cytospora mali TaxID=578113 RepID=A0A194VLJ1_CYTMA|nr:MutT-like protein [Valsa mali]
MAPTPSPPASFTFPPLLFPFNVSKEDYLSKLNEDAATKLDHLATGAIVFSSHHTDQQDRILLVQRASHDSMPNRWEIPGGAVDDGETILNGLAREVWEESGLKVKNMEAAVWEGQMFRTTRGKRVCKFTFVVEAENSGEVKLDPNEHQDHVWATEEECRAKRVVRSEEGKGATKLVFTTAPQEAAILKAFAWWKENRGASIPV